jgi:cytochrome c biogenesis protein CcmG/thiol:disulfide interchange protein DsbE
MENNWIDSRLAVLNLDVSSALDVERGLIRLRDLHRVQKRRARMRAWSAAAATACLCLMAFPTPRAAAQYCLNCSVALWQNLAASKVRHSSLIRASARKPAPDFILKNAVGRQIHLSEYQGHVVLLNFWATWCGGCRIEIPWLIEFQQAYASRGLAVLGISFDDGGWEAVNPYVAAKQINYPVMLSDSRVAAAFGGVVALPVTFVIDKWGRIAAKHAGPVRKTDYQAEIEELLRE